MDLQSFPWGGVCAVPQFINTFDPDDSRYQDNYIKGQQFTAAGDSIIATMGDFTGKPLSYRNYVAGVDGSDEVDGFRLGKFEIAKGATNRLSNDWHYRSNPSKAVVRGAQLPGGSGYDYGLRNHLKSTTEGGADIIYGRMLDELGWEFCQEARRRTDMILFPIPRTEIAKNANLTQNQGYQ